MQWHWDPEARCLTLMGELRGAEPDWLSRAMAEVGPAAVVVELQEVDVADGTGALLGVDLVRRLLTHCGRVELRHAPQLLAHNLYRVGLLEGPGVVALVEPREEEPYG